MSQHMDRYYRRRAHEHLRSELGQPLLLTSITGVLAAVQGVSLWPTPAGLAYLAGAAVLLACAVGLALAREWARRLALVLFVVLLGAQLVRIVLSGWSWRQDWGILLVVYGLVSLSSGETREAFAWARGERSTLDPSE